MYYKRQPRLRRPLTLADGGAHELAGLVEEAHLDRPHVAGGNHSIGKEEGTEAVVVTEEAWIAEDRGGQVARIVGVLSDRQQRLFRHAPSVGLAASAALARYVTSLLYEVEALDPNSFAAACLLPMGIAIAAIVRPAIRASRVDPVEALRAD